MPILLVLGAVVVGGALVIGVAVPTTIAAVGFSTGGVVSGSIAAGIQAGIGNVGAGSVFAILQAAGTAPLTTGAAGAVAGAIGAVAAAIIALVPGVACGMRLQLAFRHPTTYEPLTLFTTATIQYNTIDSNNTNHGLGITVEHGTRHGFPTSRKLPGPVVVTMRSHAGMMGMVEAEYGANFLQLIPAASGFRPGALIVPNPPTSLVQERVHLIPSASNSLGRQPTLFTKNASPQRKVAELSNVLGNKSSGRLSSKAKLIPSHLGDSKKAKSNPASPVILLEQAKSRSRVELDLLLDSGSCVEGGYVKGKVLVNVAVPQKKEGPIYLGEGKVRVVGFEAIPQDDQRHTFYHCAAEMNKISPFCHILYTSEPDEEGFCRGREGHHSIPFAMRLPQRQTNFPVAKGVYDSRMNGSSIRYIAMFSIKIKDSRKNSRSIAHFYRSIDAWPLFDPAIVLAPAPTPLYASTAKSLFMGGPGTVKLTASIHRPTWVAGQRCYVRIFVANDTEKRKVQSLSLTLVRSETIFKPNSGAAVQSPAGTRIDNDLDACTTSTLKRIIARSMLEMGEKVTPKHATAKGWWTGVEPGTSQEFNHFILLPPFALSIPRSRLIEVTFTLEASISTGPLASDVSVQLPIRIINNISLDPPPAFGPPEKLCNLPPPVSKDIPVECKPNPSRAAVKGVQFVPSTESDSETLARPQPSHIFTESGTYRGDDKMPTLGKLMVRNRASVASGTMDGQSGSRLSCVPLWGQEIRDPLSNEMEHASNELNNGYAEAARSQGDYGREPNMSHPVEVSSETKSLDEYLQGPRPEEWAQLALLSSSLDPMLGIDDYSDEEMDLVMRSVHPNNVDLGAEEGEIQMGQSFDHFIGDETHGGTTELGDVFVSTRNNSPMASQEESEEISTMFSSRAASHAGSAVSKASSISIMAVAPEVNMDNIKTTHTQPLDAPQTSDPLSPSRTARRFLPPQRPRPHPVLASKIGNAAPSGSLPQSHRPKGMTLRDSMDLSRARVGGPTTNRTARTNQIPQDGTNISERNITTVCDGVVPQERPQLVPTEPNHTKTASSATSSKIPTTISALMLQNLKTPAPAPPPFKHGTQGNTITPNASVLTETTRFGSQRFGSSTRIPPLAGASSIRARIAMFEQAQANNTPAGVHKAQSRRNTSGNGARM